MRKLIILLTLLCLPVNSFAADYVKVRISDFSGGQNSKDFFDKLSDNQGTIVKNADISNKGQAITRKGQVQYLEDVGSTAFTGLGAYYVDSSNSYLVVSSGATVQKAGSSVWEQISTSSMGVGFDTGFIQANDLLFAYNSNAVSWWDNSSWTAGGTYPGSASPPTATTATWLANYLFFAGNSTNPDWVYFSENLTPQSFDASDIRKINTGDGQAVVRLEPFRLNEIIVYKERSIFTLDISGDPDSGGFTVQPISRDVGTPAKRSVVSLGNDQWFLSSEPYAVRSLARTQFDKILVDIVSRPIQDIFDGTGDRILNTVHIDKAAAVLFDNKYMLAIATDSSSVNDFVLVYDFITQSWWTIDGWYPKDWLVYDGDLYYTDANDGRVVKCFSGTTGDLGTVSDSASGPTVAIDYQYATKGIDFGVPENFKQLDSIILEFFPTGNYDATVSIDIDNNGFQEVGTVNLLGDALTLPFTLPATLEGEGLTTQTLQLTQYGEFKRIAVKVSMNDAIDQQAKLQAITIVARIKSWRRE